MHVLLADVSVELAVCSLLLGDTIQAEDALRLGPNNAADDADPAVRSFVMVCCFLAGCTVCHVRCFCMAMCHVECFCMATCLIECFCMAMCLNECICMAMCHVEGFCMAMCLIECFCMANMACLRTAE